MELILLIGITFGVTHFFKAKQLQAENRMLTEYMDSMEIFCEEMQKKIELTRRFRHDLAGYIQTLEHLAESHRICSDDFLDTILQMKQKSCMELGIPFQIDIADEDYTGMEPMDRVCLFVNLLDNAIEATERIPLQQKAAIVLKVWMEENHLHIYIENSIPKGESFSFHSKKADKLNHGLGTSIINQVLNKYHGTRNIKLDKERAIVMDHIHLSLERREDESC